MDADVVGHSGRPVWPRQANHSRARSETFHLADGLAYRFIRRDEVDQASPTAEPFQASFS